MQNLKTPLLMFLIPGCLAYGFYYFYAQQRKTFDFPKTQATLESVGTRYSEGWNYVYVDYEYEVEGEYYQGYSTAVDVNGQQLNYQNDYSAKKKLDRIEKLKERGVIQVYYDPENHGESFTYPSANGGLIVGTVITGLFSLLGLLGVLTALFYNKKNPTLNEDQSRELISRIIKRGDR